MVGEALEVSQAAWSLNVEQILERGVHDDLVSVVDLRRMVANGFGQVFEVKQGGKLIGAFVLQQNRCTKGNELVMLCASADLPGFGTFTRTIMPWVEQQARLHGFDRVRVDVGRRGMGRLLGGMDYTLLSETYIKDTSNVF